MESLNKKNKGRNPLGIWYKDYNPKNGYNVEIKTKYN